MRDGDASPQRRPWFVAGPLIRCSFVAPGTGPLSLSSCEASRATGLPSDNGQNPMIRTHALVERTLEEDRAIFEHHGRLAVPFYLGGMALVLLAIGAWAISRRRHERGLQARPVVLIAFYGLRACSSSK